MKRGGAITMGPFEEAIGWEVILDCGKTLVVASNYDIENLSVDLAGLLTDVEPDVGGLHR